ncbi:hypothetical protein LSH36_440g00000 [Paralvinella palmiformis]|uniref:Uncharacterized protein n=1 Tax=Paralvinella palmiformis TaxID=53620 RepID=A0AAD9N0G8_9ANNE|nr:hypothetical protein LSH36_440g00000 [Paralvinella palmiformis]
MPVLSLIRRGEHLSRASLFKIKSMKQCDYRLHLARPRLGTILEEDEGVSYVSEIYQTHRPRIRRSISKSELIESLRNSSSNLRNETTPRKPGRSHEKNKHNMKAAAEKGECKNKSLLKRFVSFMTVPRADSSYS